MLSLDELMPSDDELGLLLQDAGKGPEGNLLHAEQHHLLHQAILRIPAPLRIVLVLHDMEELTTEQVAQILDLQQGTVQNSASSGTPERSQGDESAPEWRCRSRWCSRRPAEAGQRPADPRASGARMNAAICLPTSLNIWMAEWNLLTCDQMREHIEACPSCVAFLRDLRAAIDRCRSLEVPCDPAVAPRLRAILTREYLRMLVMPAAK